MKSVQGEDSFTADGESAEPLSIFVGFKMSIWLLISSHPTARRCIWSRSDSNARPGRRGLCGAIFVLLCFCCRRVIHERLFRVMMKYMTVSEFKRKQLTPSEEFSADNKVDSDITEHLFCLFV